MKAFGCRDRPLEQRRVKGGACLCSELVSGCVLLHEGEEGPHVLWCCTLGVNALLRLCSAAHSSKLAGGFVANLNNSVMLGHVPPLEEFPRSQLATSCDLAGMNSLRGSDDAAADRDLFVAFRMPKKLPVSCFRTFTT